MATLVYLACITVASFAVLAQPAVAQRANITLPLTYPARVLQGEGNQTCPPVEQYEMLRNTVRNTSQRLLQEGVLPLLQYSCGGSAGWRRVAYLNMSDPSQQCPSVWKEITTPHRVCGRKSTRYSCEGLNYTTGSEQYDQVCGRIIGYQLGTPYCFYGPGGSIDGYPVYVDGVSVTHGFPRQHIWTFAAGTSENIFSDYDCPCVIGSRTGEFIPSFVGMNYFCESGIKEFDWSFIHNFTALHLWPDGDPLWDGQGCGPTSNCCTFNSPPWFNVQLFPPTTDDIEVRICGTRPNTFFDSPIQLIELYVK